MFEVLASLIIFFLLILAFIEFGFRLRVKNLENTRVASSAKSTVNGFLLTLLGLLCAFNLNSARDRFSERHSLVLREVNVLRSTLASANTLPMGIAEVTIPEVKRYIAVRAKFNQALNAGLPIGDILIEGREILHQAENTLLVGERRDGNDSSIKKVLEQLDQLRSIASERQVLVRPPDSTVALGFLVILALVAALLIGTDLEAPANAHRFHRFLFAGIVAILLTIIFDYDSPRIGLINLQHDDRLLSELRE